jgi:hypothetical protein
MHGTVWWKKNSKQFLETTLINNTGKLKLVDLFENAFTLALPPNWMDTSTIIECFEISDGLKS